MLSKFADFQENDFDLNSSENRHHWGARRAYIALVNMLTVAALRGIDSQTVEAFHIARTTEMFAKDGLLDPKSDLPVMIASFGYRDMEMTPKTHCPLQETIKWV